jgi:hypothetical protein
MKRKINYVTNVLVVKDPANKDAEGKVFLWKFGQQVFDCITLAMNPKEEGADPVAVFNPFLGANFKIQMHPKEVNGDIVPVYEKSSFSDLTGMLADDEDEVLEICAKAYKLSEFDTAGKGFKTYEELQRKLYEVCGPTVGSGISTVEGWESNVAPAPKEESAPRQQSRPAAAVKNEDLPFDPDDDIPDSVTSVASSTTSKASTADLDPELAKILLG